MLRMPNQHVGDIEFSDCNDAVHQLAKAKDSWMTLVGKRRCEAPADWDVVVKRYLGPNTLRGFHHQTPLINFQHWAGQHFQKDQFASLIGQPDEMSFDRAHSKLVDNLISGWPAAIKYGQAAKLIDLAVRSGYESSLFDTELLDKAEWFIHVPLDEYVLVAIRSCAKTFSGPDAIRHIPKRPSMGFVKSYEEYKALQYGIRSVAKKADVPPIVLDHIRTLWKQSHALQN